jgi:hypothetical protein
MVLDLWPFPGQEWKPGSILAFIAPARPDFNDIQNKQS